MADIRDNLAALKIEDEKKFLAIRTLMRKTYLHAIAHTVGIAGYRPEDDTFMDAIDIKVEMLFKRAGIETPTSENKDAEINSAFDPFTLITRPQRPTSLVVDEKKMEADMKQPGNGMAGWGRSSA